MNAQFQSPQGIVAHPITPNLLYAADVNCLRQINSSTVTTKPFLSLPHITGITIDNSGKRIYGGTFNVGYIYLILTSNWTVSYFAGSSSLGFQDGTLTSSTFSSPVAVEIDLKKNMYIADSANNAIRFINSTATTVTTISGSRK